MTSIASPKHCKDCLDEIAVRAYGEKIPAKLRPAPYPGPRCATHHRVEQLRRKQATRAKRIETVYGLTAQQHAALLRFQGGACAICQRAKGTTRALAVDHDHSCCDGPTSCGKCVRGLLCRPCNRMLGHMRDNPEMAERAADYLRNWPTVRARNASATGGSTKSRGGLSAAGATGGEL